MAPAQAGEAVEVGVRGDEGAAVLGVGVPTLTAAPRRRNVSVTGYIGTDESVAPPMRERYLTRRGTTRRTPGGGA
jgi:hypothetical protein